MDALRAPAVEKRRVPAPLRPADPQAGAALAAVGRRSTRSARPAPCVPRAGAAWLPDPRGRQAAGLRGPACRLRLPPEGDRWGPAPDRRHLPAGRRARFPEPVVRGGGPQCPGAHPHRDRNDRARRPARADEGAAGDRAGDHDRHDDRRLDLPRVDPERRPTGRARVPRTCCASSRCGCPRWGSPTIMRTSCR